jgi:manganese transport protein
MAAQLRPILGPAAELFCGVGLFAAGLTSAITAPLAAAYATAGVLGWSTDLRAWPFRTVWAVIVIVGAGFAFAGERPIDAILVAQAANGLLLPIVACFLLVAMNRRTLLGEHVNRAWANVLGAGVVLIVTGLGVLKILNVLNNRVF